jgi:ABC-type nitrate/sulfonate/bicarbonate transport system substrate-binding protein
MAANDPAGARGRAWLALALALALAVGCAPPARDPTPAARPAGGVESPAGAGPAAAPREAAAPTRPPAAPLDVIKVGYLGLILSNAGIFLAAERGYFAEQGIVVDLVPFDGGPRMVPALATNEIQVGGGSPGVGLYNALARGIRSKVVADKASNPPGTVSASLMVRKDLYDSGAITRLEDLRGHTFGLMSFDSSLEFTLAYHLSLVGMTPADLPLVEIPNSDLPLAYANRTLEASWALDPISAVLAERGLAVRLLSGDERHPNQQSSVMMYSEQFAAQSDPATRWMIAYLKGVRDYNDAFVAGINREETIQVLERVGVITDRAVLERYGVGGLNPNGYVNRQHLQQLHDYFVRKGSITQPVALDDLVDDRFVAAALARIGLYDSPIFRDAVWLR